jgi:fermentation-respiration switch protein FrsA (DUF1100 family)
MAPRYAELRVPLVIVHGTADQNVPIEQARRIYGAASDSVLIEIPEAGHPGFLRRFPGLMGKLLGKKTGRVRASGEV